VATPDGKEVMRTGPRTAPFTPEDAVRLGKEAGAQLKADARPGFFMW
jgi:hypothetical protein